MDGGWIGRGDAGAVGVVVAGRQGADPAAVPAGAHGAIRGVVPGRSARARAAQDGLDAGGGGGRSWPLAAAGPAWSISVGRGCTPRCGARLCGRDPGRAGCGAGHRRNGLSQAGKGPLGCWPPVHGLGRQDRQLPNWGVRRLHARQGARLHRPPALPPSRLDQKPRSPARGACAGSGRVTTKPRLALDMVERAIAAGVPFAWVAADTVYGTGEVEMALRRSGKGYVLGASATQPFNAWIGKPEVAGTAEAIARGLEPSAWMRLSAGEGTKGARLYDWAYLELADLVADEFNPTLRGTWTRGLLIRRSLTDGELAYFSTWCPAGTPIQTLVSVEGRRWAIEDAFETAKTELGLAHNETRSWHGWHRHVSLVMLAFAMMAAV